MKKLFCRAVIVGAAFLPLACFAQLVQTDGIQYWVAAQGSWRTYNVVSFVYGEKSCNLEEATDSALDACEKQGLLNCDIALIKRMPEASCHGQTNRNP